MGRSPRAAALAALRADIKRKQRNAGAKMSRNKSKGIYFEGTELDPRIALSKIGKLNTTQLRAHAARLDAFTSRKNQYVASAFGQPISKEKLDKALAQREKINKIAEARRNVVANYDDPVLGMKMRQRTNVITPDVPTMHGNKVRTPYDLKELDPTNINGPAALDKLIRSQERNLEKGHLKREIKEARARMGKALEDTGDMELINRVKALTDNQIDVFWFEAKYGHELFPFYIIAQARNAGPLSKANDRMLTDFRNDLHRALAHIEKTVPEKAP